MPYIAPERRPAYDPAIADLVAKLREAPVEKLDGDLNYVITRLLLGGIDKPSYFSYNARLGVLEACKLEFFRRHVATYEDEAIVRNGDLS